VIAGAACVLAGITASRLGTWVPAAWTLVFAARTAWLVGPWSPGWPARRLGWMEAVLGGAACLSVGLALK